LKNSDTQAVCSLLPEADSHLVPQVASYPICQVIYTYIQSNF